MMKNEITALSLFNGAGGAFMALNELGIPVKKLYVSEIDKFANKAADLLCPYHIQLGDITKWDEWEDGFGVDFGEIDIVFAGFPCQAWSLAGKQGGDNDPRGALVHDLLDMYGYIKALNPNIKFMFENVAMKKVFMDYINDLFGCEPVMINSALVVAQNRKRNYWSNWDITQPEDRGILLKDIIEQNADEKHNLSDKLVQGFANKKARYEREGKPGGFGKMNIPSLDGKCSTLTARYFKCGTTDPYVELRPCELRDTQPTDSALCHHAATATDIKANESNKRVYADTGKSPTLTTMGGGHREPKVLAGDKKYRKLTPKECMRLQGWPDWVIDKLLSSGISNSQLYKMTGNGWTHPVIVHNLQCLLDTGWPENIA